MGQWLKVFHFDLDEASLGLFLCLQPFHKHRKVTGRQEKGSGTGGSVLAGVHGLAPDHGGSVAQTAVIVDLGLTILVGPVSELVHLGDTLLAPSFRIQI